MPSLSAVRASNSAWRPAYRPVVVVAGGTNGVGAGVAAAFAKYSPKETSKAPYIIIIGRSKQSADQVISQMKSLNSQGTYEFVQGDLTLMTGVRNVAKQVNLKVDKVNFLCMSQGIMTLKTHDDTEEGIDRKVALHFYSRFLLTSLLMAKLEKAQESGEDARMLTILTAGRGGPIYENDLGLKEHKSLKAKMDTALTYNDLMVEELGLRYPKLSFTHAYPGAVNTNILREMPWYLKMFSPLAALLTVSREDCGENMIYNLLRPEHRTGTYYLDNHGENVKQKGYYYGNKEIRDKVWKHAEEVTGSTSG